jgi:hypothetical protein
VSALPRLQADTWRATLAACHQIAQDGITRVRAGLAADDAHGRKLLADVSAAA